MSKRRAAPLFVALAAVAAVVVPYLALGGTSYAPTPVADPCKARAWRNPGDIQETLEQIVLSALDGTACELHVSREDLVLALADEQSLDRFASAHGISRADAERALHDGLVRAVDDADRAGALSGPLGAIVRSTVERIPARLVLDLLQQLRGLVGALP